MVRESPCLVQICSEVAKRHTHELAMFALAAGMPDSHLLLCLRMPFETTATLFLLALSAGKLAASLSRALLYLRGSMTTPGVFRILGRVRFLRQVDRRLRNLTEPGLHLILGMQGNE